MILYAIALFEYVNCRQRGNLAADRVYRETNFVLSLIEINRAFCERGFHFFYDSFFYNLVSLLKLKTIHKCVLCPHKRQILMLRSIALQGVQAHWNVTDLQRK